MTTASPVRAAEVDYVELGGRWVHKSVPALYQHRVTGWPHDVCDYRKEGGRWVGTTAAEGARQVRELAQGLLALGVQRGDRVALVCGTRPEWLRVDLAILHAGAVTVGVYPTLPAAEVAYQLEHAGCVAAVVEDLGQLEKLRAHRDALPALRAVFVIDPPGPAGALADAQPLAALAAAGRALPDGEARFEAAWRAVGPKDLATIIYTSGTTGQPKGAMLTHGNLTFVVHASAAVLPFGPGDTSVVFLPLAHSLQRVVSYGGIFVRATGYWASSLDRLMDELREVEPTVQVSVPRIWEKVHARLLERVAASPPHRQRLFRWALDVGRRAGPYRQAGRPLPLRLRVAHELARRVVFDRLKERLFGRNLRYLTSGGAPIARELLETFHALGILILEGWGLTETAAPVTVNRPDAYALGTVGLPLPGTEVRVAPDGELLVRGPGVFAGYFRDPEASSEAFTEDLFFRTGDVGEVDARGFVRITDRKKNLIILANGKNVAPQKLEGVFGQAPLVEHVLAVGDGHPYLVGLVTLDHDELARWAQAQGLCGPTPDAAALRALCAHPRVRAHVDAGLRAQNEPLAPFEQLKRWDVLDETWSVDDGALTPTLKLKRKVLEARHAARIAALYAQGRG